MQHIRRIKNIIKKVAKFITALPFIIKFVAILALISVVITAVDWLIEIFTSKNTPNHMYSVLEVEDMRDLVEIKKSDDDSGYYLAFKDRI